MQDKKTEIVVISALAENRAIGKDGKLPWHLPEDLQRFRALTLHHTVIMGRKTWEMDLGQRPLRDRTNIVLSKRYFEASPLPSRLFTEPNLCFVPSIAAALQQVQSQSLVFIIGGASIYAQTLHLADRLELTLVEGDVEGDAFFPEYELLLRDHFILTQEVSRPGYRFLTYHHV